MAQDIFILKAQLETLLIHIKAHGHDGDKVLKGTGFDPSIYPHIMSPVPATIFDAINREGEALLSDPLFAMHAGLATNGEEYGWSKFSVASLPDFKSAMHLAVQNTNGVPSPITMENEESKVGESIVMTPRFPISEFIQIYIEMMMGVGSGISKIVTGKRLTPDGVSFTHAPRAKVSAYTAALGVQPDFNATKNVLAYSKQSMDTPSLKADLVLSEMSQKVTEEQAQNYQSGEGELTRVVLGFLNTANTPWDWKLEAVAEKLLLPPRTLQYRLTQSGSSFMELVETVRKTRAASLLEGGVGQAEIAYQLGYAEVGAFRKAFQRWHGVSPSAWQSGQGGAVVE